MYKEGELILYGNTGVCRIVEIKERSFANSHEKHMYYVLKPLYQDCTISTPIDNPKVFMRPIISMEDANQLIDMIPNIQAEAYHSRVLSQLSEHYNAALKTHNCEDLLELTMSIYAKKQDAEQQKRKFGATDERFMKRAEELLFGELAAALNIPKESVPEYIDMRIGEKSKK